jgi:hypothetical protein
VAVKKAEVYQFNLYKIMNPIWRGTIPFESVPYTIEFDEYGVGSSTITVQYRFQDPSAAAQKIANIITHPNFPWLKRKKATVNRQEADLAVATITFEGIPPETSKKSYKCSRSTNSEPISTHPDFNEWVSEGIFEIDEKGKAVFVGDSESKSVGGNQSFAGVESYLVPNAMYEETWVQGQGGGNADFSKIGKVDNPPASPVRPNLRGDANWLFMGGDIEVIGFGTKMTRKWKASGPRGWNTRIY